MRGKALFLTITVLFSGCFSFPIDDGTIGSDEHQAIDHGQRDLFETLVIEEGGELMVSNSHLTVHGDVIVRGTLSLQNSILEIRMGDESRSLKIYGGSVTAIESKILGADALFLRQGHLSATGGILSFGRLISTDGALVDMIGVTIEAKGSTVGDYGGTASMQIEDGHLNATDSVLPNSYYIGEDSTARFLNTTVNLNALGGPGYKVSLQRLRVIVSSPGGGPIANATVSIQSAMETDAEAQGVTDSDGVVDLEQIVFDWDLIPVYHDPHLILVEGLPVGTSIAATGDSTEPVVYPGTI